MAIILRTEKKHKSSLILFGGLYLLLIIGAFSMIYPFLLMLSGSVKSRIDANDMDVIPRYLYDDNMLYRKYNESKYNENMQLYLDTNLSRPRNFRAAPIPENNPALVKDFTDFIKDSSMPSGWFMVGFGPTRKGDVIQKNELNFRNHVRDLCDNNLDTFKKQFNEPIENWFFLKFKPERLTDRKYQLAQTPLINEFYKFKKTLPLEDRIYVSCKGGFKRFAKLSFPQEPVAELTENPRKGAWESYVRNSLSPQFIRVKDAAKDAWRKFLSGQYGTIANLNKIYQTKYKSFKQVTLPENRLKASAMLTDYILFISDAKYCPLSALYLDTPELRWQKFLFKRYKSIDKAAAAHKREYKGFNNIPMPQTEYDYASCMANKWSIRSSYMSSNFIMVFDYILFYGRGIYNTIIYCSLSIALALLVNPMAAYALSRYNMPNQYKILLFLIATMAFPAVVTMIPNFLLLRDLGLLNTFAALILPTMANGYAIFLLKGFFDSLPKELFEAAEIDGATEWNKFWIITMNLSKPILAVIALGAFNGAYSNFMFAFILCQDRSMWTMMVWLYQLQQFSSQGVVFASLIVAAIPTLLIFILCQNVIIRGIVVPTEK